MNRKKFIHHAGILALLPQMLHMMQSCNEVSNRKVLVVIQLVGGNDGLNTIVPVDQYAILSKARKNLLIDEHKLLDLKGTSTLKMHPSLSGFRDMFQHDLVNVIQGVGYEHPVYSHFRATDIYLSGSSPDEYMHTGWMARYLEYVLSKNPNAFKHQQLTYPPAIKVGDSGSLLFMGNSLDMSVVMNSIDQFSYHHLPKDLTYDNHVQGQKLNYIRDVLLQTQQYGPALENIVKKQNPDFSGYPTTGKNPLADKLRIVSKLIRSGLQTPVYLIEFKGFDTHQDQVDSHNPAKGLHAELLSHFSEAVSAFWNDIVKMGMEDEVMGTTISEFGRRIVSNGSFGSDHGAAQPVFVFGKKVKPGIVGNHPEIPANVTVNDNLNAAFDFRDVYASLLRQWFNADESMLNEIFKKDYLKQIPIA